MTVKYQERKILSLNVKYIEVDTIYLKNGPTTIPQEMISKFQRSLTLLDRLVTIAAIELF